jgi:hypothetical protein
MGKWADYLISAIRYENETNNNLFAYLKVHQDNGEEIGAGSTWSRDEVINAMHDGKTFYTIQKSNTGEWKKGSIVSLITKNGKTILTDYEYTDLDYLADVQEL